MGLNDRQRRFAEYYAATPNATEAARAAGYSSGSARSQGQRLLTNADIQNYIRELQQKLASERIADISEIRERVTGILRSESEKTRDRLKAADTLLKSSGAYLPPSEEDFPRIAGKETEGEGVRIALPWNGQQAITAILDESGNLVPLAEAGEHVDIYLSWEDVEALLHSRFYVDSDKEVIDDA